MTTPARLPSNSLKSATGELGENYGNPMFARWLFGPRVNRGGYEQHTSDERPSPHSITSSARAWDCGANHELVNLLRAVARHDVPLGGVIGRNFLDYRLRHRLVRHIPVGNHFSRVAVPLLDARGSGALVIGAGHLDRPHHTLKAEFFPASVDKSAFVPGLRSLNPATHPDFSRGIRRRTGPGRGGKTSTGRRKKANFVPSQMPLSTQRLGS
jgi:hypothetical protein